MGHMTTHATDAAPWAAVPVQQQGEPRGLRMAKSSGGEADTEVARLLRDAGVGTYSSAREFAKLCGVSHETVSRLLRAPKLGEPRKPITKATSDALADGAGISRKVFEAAVLADLGYSQAVTGIDGVQSVLAQLRGMSDADRRKVLAELAQEIAQRPSQAPGA